MSFGEHVDRALYLSHHDYHQLVSALLDCPHDAFLKVLPDYPSWRAGRASAEANRLSRLAQLAEQAATEAESCRLGHDQDPVPARPRRRDSWRRRA